MRGTIICLLLAICFCGVYGDQAVVGDIDILTGTTIYKYLEEADRPVFIQFYAGNCNFCKALAPLWAQLSRERSEEKIAVVDCITEEILCEAWEINAVPAMFLYRGGQLFPYDGTRELEDLHDFLDKNSKNVAPVGLPDETAVKKAIFREEWRKHGQGVTITFIIFGVLFFVGLLVCFGCCCTPTIDNETITKEDGKPEAPKKPAEEPNKKVAEPKKQGGEPKKAEPKKAEPNKKAENKAAGEPNKKVETPKKQEGNKAGAKQPAAGEAKKQAGEGNKNKKGEGEPKKAEVKKQEGNKAAGEAKKQGGEGNKNKKVVAEVIPKKEEKPVNSTESRKRKNNNKK